MLSSCHRRRAVVVVADVPIKIVWDGLYGKAGDEHGDRDIDGEQSLEPPGHRCRLCNQPSRD